MCFLPGISLYHTSASMWQVLVLYSFASVGAFIQIFLFGVIAKQGFQHSALAVNIIIMAVWLILVILLNWECASDMTDTTFVKDDAFTMNWPDSDGPVNSLMVMIGMAFPFLLFSLLATFHSYRLYRDLGHQHANRRTT